MANEYPEFGGFYVDEAEGTLVIWTTDPSSRRPDTARDALISVVGSYDLHRLQPTFKAARYSFRQLKPWHNELTRSTLSRAGVVLTDIDDRRNRLRVGVEDLDRHAPGVEHEVDRLGIPREAVVIEEVAPAVPLSSVRDRHRPLLGGLQIATTKKMCSLGVVGIRNGLNGFVTNSHCTDVQGGVEGTRFGQPDASLLSSLLGTSYVGKETVDPQYFTGGTCPSGRKCRYSDSAFVETSTSTGLDLGRIANPDGVSWNGTSKYRIVSEWNEPPTGTTVFKVGRTTGKTSGTMTGTCLNVNQRDTSFTMLCEAQASYGGQGGDSGGPVFRIVAGSDVELVGVVWGEETFSDWYSGVQDRNELYLVSTCAAGYNC